jgi:penicillin-binding protein 1C
VRPARALGAALARLRELSGTRSRRALVASALLALAAPFGLRALAPPAPSYAVVRAQYAPSEARLLDRHGRVLHERRVSADERRLAWTPLAEISPALPAAVLAIEDRRFFAHGGVDLRALGGALLAQLRGERRGASTVTMQLAAQLDAQLRASRGARTLRQKARQVALALALERGWTKPHLLEAYLNLVSFRGELVGVNAAARGLFDKAPSALDANEAWLLAALLCAPGAGPSAVASRACALARLRDAGASCAVITARAESALARAPRVRPPAAFAPHLAARLLQARGDVRTTLDADVQRSAQRALAEQLAQLAEQRVRDGAVLVVENASGDVLAWVGSSGARSASPRVDFVRARRQAGSTLKPFVYALAFEDRLLTPASLLDDSPLELPTGFGSYRPENYDRRFHGAVPARIALGSSLNVPAVRALERVGVDRAVVALRALGVAGLTRADHYGPSLALGAADVTLYELVSAYRALARGGEAGLLRVRSDDPHGVSARVLDAGASFLVADILADRGSRSLSFGLESALATHYWSAVKTGTSKDMRDNWCVGFSEKYTAGVWVGNGGGEPMWDVSGVDGAAPVWAAVMSALHASEPSAPPKPPRDVVRTPAGYALRGTEAAGAAAAAHAAPHSGLARIVSPARDLVIAFDPDIPPDQQRVLIEAQPADAALAFALDGALLGSAGEPHFWALARGRHELVLRDAAGEERDRVEFVVR